MSWILKLKELAESEKGRKTVLVLGVAVMIVLLLSCWFTGEESVPHESASSAELEEALERRLERLLSQISGVSSPVVMLTLDSSEESVFAVDSSSTLSSSEDSRSSQNEESIVLGGSSREPLIASSVMPRVRGVAVVCGGADSPAVREKVINTVAGVLNISTSRIYVTY